MDTQAKVFVSEKDFQKKLFFFYIEWLQ
jgi:hypothetical protein